jgi:hypothetical protein
VADSDSQNRRYRVLGPGVADAGQGSGDRSTIGAKRTLILGVEAHAARLGRIVPLIKKEAEP